MKKTEVILALEGLEEEALNTIKLAVHQNGMGAPISAAAVQDSIFVLQSLGCTPDVVRRMRIQRATAAGNMDLVQELAAEEL